MLVVQDVFSRRVFAEPLAVNSPETVAAAFGRIVEKHGKPSELDTDGGPEFTTRQFPKLIERLGTAHVVKDTQDRNAIATVDRAIATLKVSLKKVLSKLGSRDWAGQLNRVVNGMNAGPHEALFGAAPKDVSKDNANLYFNLEEKNIRLAAGNYKHITRRATRLEELGAFRVLLPPTTKGVRANRVDTARYSGEVHKVALVDRGYVEDTEGRRYATKLVLPVPKSSASVAEGRRGGSTQMEDKRRGILGPFAKDVVVFLHKMGSEVSLAHLADFLDRQAPTKGFRKATLEAGLSQKNALASFIRTFPDKFTLHTAASGGASSVRLAAAV